MGSRDPALGFTRRAGFSFWRTSAEIPPSVPAAPRLGAIAQASG